MLKNVGFVKLQLILRWTSRSYISSMSLLQIQAFPSLLMRQELPKSGNSVSINLEENCEFKLDAII